MAATSKNATDDFDAFYAARGPGLVRSLYARTGNMDRAAECTQEAFIRAWMRWPSLHHENPVAWVRAVAWNLAISDWRAKSREHARLMGADAREAVRAEPVAEMVAVRKAVATLPTAQQSVIVLHYFEDLSIASIAELESLPENTVKSHLRRGRVALRALLDDSVDDSTTSDAPRARVARTDYPQGVTQGHLPASGKGDER
jgi:RNA polymerase sigma-70 factor (ECF subfamily)